MPTLAETFDQLGIAFARIRLRRGANGAVAGLSLIDSNAAFAEQTGVPSDARDRYAELAFGDGLVQALTDHETAAAHESATFSLFYPETARWFSCHTHCEADDLLRIVILDITRYHHDSALTQLRERAYRSFIEHLPMIAFLRIVAPEPVALFTAGSFREITGYGPEKGINFDSWMQVVHPDDREWIEHEANLLYRDPDYEQELEYRIVRADGAVRWVRSYDRHFPSDDGTMEIVQGLILDVTEQKEREQALETANSRINEQNRMLARLARTDPLTGLLNRRAMQEQLERELRMMSRGRSTFTILLLDLDEFKDVNDRHGHRAGDRVLQHLAETLTEQVRSSDVQSRWGGEEFMVLFSGTTVSRALPVATKLLEWFGEHPTRVDDANLRVSFTGGLVEAVSGDTVDSLFSRADRALYEGKAAGRNRIVVGPPPDQEGPRKNAD